MEMALQQQRLLCCSGPPMERRQFAIRPAVGLFIQTAVQCREFRRRRAMPCIIASSGPSEYSRRRPRRNLAPRTKGSTPKGFTPRPTSTQKKDQSSIKETIVETGTADSGSELNILTSEVPRRIDVLEEVEERSYEEDGVDKKAFLKIPSVAIYNDESSERGSLVGGEGDRVSLSAQSLSTSDSFDEIGEGKVTGLTSEGGGVSLSAQSRSTSDSVDEIGEGKVTGLTSEGDGVSLSAQSRSTSDSFDEIEEGKVTGLTSEGDGVSLSAQSLSTSDSFDEIGEGKVTGLTSEGDGVSLSAQSLSAGDSFDEFGEGKVTGLRSEGDVVSLSAQSLSTSDSFDEIGEGKVTGLTGEGDGVNLSAQSLSTSDSFDEIGEGKVKGLTGEIDGVSLSAQSLSTSDNFDEIGEGKVTGLTSEIDEQNADSEHHVTIAGRTSSLSYNEEVEIEVMAENDRDVAQDEELHEVDEYPMDVEADARDSTLSRKADIEAQARKQILEDIAEENFERGDKVFTIPNSIKCDQIIEVYLNRSLSALSNESDVLLKGAFNGWRWNFFTEKLHKSDLKGDWWSCQLYVPKEAYRIDFVFFNGGNIYENNNSKDYFLPVESRMDEAAFEDFLFEEKQRELERIAAEEAERERQAEEQRRKEEEKAAFEADRAQAKIDVEKKRQTLQRQMQLARTSLENVWHIVPNVFKGGETVRLFYNRSSRPLAHATEIWIHGGHNSWSDGLSIVERLLPSEKRDGDWWYADVVVPNEALVLDWVFADGPPQSAKIYDNNSLQDFHATVPKCMSEELFWVEEEERIFRKLQQERRLKQEAVRKKVEKTAQLKAQTKENTLKKFLLSQKHIVYTEPLEIRAGSTVAVLYNPSNTILSGKPEVWFRCSFNRWTHRNGPLPPQKMVNAENGSHLKATVKIPADAYMMDFVFSEREDGGIYDNRNGMDYHIPVSEGILKEPPMHIVHIAVEMAPIAKVGGLGDVVTSLSRAVQDLGHNVDIIFPKYDCMNLSNVKDFHFRQSFSWGGTEIKVWFGTVEGLSVYFLEPQNGMFWVGCIYGRNDGDRFAFFCRAALEFLLQSGSRPDILHCHDWSSAPVAWMFKEHYRHGLSNARVIFTIHNLEFGIHHISRAMTYADKATTVSHRYSKEVSGNPAISPHLYKFHGILNGIDPDIWDPYNDNFIPVSYTAENVVEGKKAAKEALQQRLGLRKSDYPLVGIITRLTVQKGIHLIKHAIWRTLERNGQVVLLGTAPDHRIQNEFVNLANQLHSSHADRARLCLTYDEPLSHLIYAGADFILVPSIFEPCGLTQLIAMRYGSIPIVRKTGGLYDTVFDIDNDKERAQAQGLEPNGFNFDGADTSSVDYALNRAISAWSDAREWFNSVCKRVMEQDWSWNRPALDYMELYHSARKY